MSRRKFASEIPGSNALACESSISTLTTRNWSMTSSALRLTTLGISPLTEAARTRPILVPYQAATGAPPKRTMKGPYGKVEILGAGQQFVADGVHPSGARYQWGLLADSAASLPLRDALPAVTEEQISQFLAAVTPLLGSSSEDAAKSGAVAKHAANVAGDDLAVLPSQASLTAIDLLGLDWTQRPSAGRVSRRSP